MLSLAEKALLAWDLQGQLSLIKQRENAVYALQTAGAKYALRVHRANYHSDAALNSEAMWLNALEQVGISVPKMIPTSAGGNFCTVATDNIDAPRQVDLLAWVNGKQLGSVEDGLGDDRDAIRNIYFTIGEVAARVHNQTSDWTVPAEFLRHVWDADGLVGEQPFWGQFWKLAALTNAQREMVLQAKAVLLNDLHALRKSPQDYSLIHADLVPENILLDGDKVQIIDFDDAGFGWHLFELATVLYFIQSDPNYGVARDALIEGYRRHRALSDDKLVDLPMFLAARSLTYLGWVHTREKTATAIELTPMLIEMSCDAVAHYLDLRSA